MNCEHAQRLLLAGPDEASPPGAGEALKAHLAACPVCRRERKRLVRLDQTLVGWVAAAPLCSEEATRSRISAARTRGRVRVRRAAAATGHLAGMIALRAALILTFVLSALGFTAALGVPQARTLVQLGLTPLGGGEATLPVLPIVGDRVWVEAAAPEREQGLTARPTFVLQLGYTLVSAPEALLSVRLAAQPAGQTRYFAAPVRVQAGTNRAVVRFSVDDARARQLLATGAVQIEVVMRGAAASGEAPLLARTTYGSWQLP